MSFLWGVIYSTGLGSLPVLNYFSFSLKRYESPSIVFFRVCTPERGVKKNNIQVLQITHTHS